ncbi:MAG: lecithin retinol acyltransferase family protein [Ruminococcus sp.]|nr:lecithin retinol acyltransferase family protein [Ruminococcus sp.]
MSIFDGDRSPINIPFPTMGGLFFWEELDCQKGYTLQKHVIEGHCRILDSDDIRVAWGTEIQMRAKFRELVDPDRHAEYGDIIGVHRGLYDHYGVYESDEVIYHYAAENGDFGKACIHITTLEKFIGESGNYFVLEFPENYGTPAKVEMPVEKSITAYPVDITREIKELAYHLYTPSETIERARSRLGEGKYNLIVNNCEHFAIWCKTGIHESHQVNGLIDILSNVIVKY